MPVRSPLTSAMNTGTPIVEKFSAIVCSVTVLPVPVAPVIRPWRLASRRQQVALDVRVLRDQQRFGHGVKSKWMRSMKLRNISTAISQD